MQRGRGPTVPWPLFLPLFTQVTLLWSSGAAPGGDVDLGFRPGRRGTGVARDQHAVDLPGYVALEAADDLSLALALLCAPRDVLLGASISAHPSQADHVQRSVSLPVATAVETVPHDLAEGGFAPQPLRIVPSHDQERRGAVGADARQRDQLRGRLRHQPIEVRV